MVDFAKCFNTPMITLDIINQQTIETMQRLTMIFHLTLLSGSSSTIY